MVARTRGALADVGVTQPRWWVLHQLSRHPDGVGRDEVIATVERMAGITDAEFATTISVLQRTIANVGGDAWHW